VCSELILWEVVGQLMGRRSPVDGCHVCVDSPSGRDYRVKSLDLLGCQLYGAGADVLLEPGYVLGAGDGDDVVALGQQSSESHLRGTGLGEGS
jgi:hypothetical protein